MHGPFLIFSSTAQLLPLLARSVWRGAIGRTAKDQEEDLSPQRGGPTQSPKPHSSTPPRSAAASFPSQKEEKLF
ncbi:unnamed protein product [Urochloa humidicola]